MDKQAENEGNSSKRIKLSTSEYLYKTRFEEGRGSDIKIIALSREWNLHKIFLEKSPYFQCMFSGPWIEATQREINIKIEDDNITKEALHKVFESLYIDEIQIEDTEVIPILACASLFQLDDLIENCAEVMKACINRDTAVLFYEASERYGIKEVKSIALDWLKRNMDNHVVSKLDFFSSDLIREIFSSPEICAPNEKCIFYILLFFMFLEENNISKNSDSFKGLGKKAVSFFKGLENEKAFLETDSGIKYQPLFRTLRLKNLILYDKIDAVQSYNIIPKDWLISAFQSQWYHVLRIDEGTDKGPKSEKVSEEEFNRECIRESGEIRRNTPWVVMKRFDFGFGLLYKYDNGCFYIKRKHSVDSVSSNSNKRNLMYRVTLYSVDEDHRVLSKAETGLETISLAPNEQLNVLTVVSPMTFPVIYRINFLVTTPLPAGS